MNTLSLAPKVSPADVERMFNTHIQDVLLVGYLANTIRTQIDPSNRLASANFGATTPLQPRLLQTLLPGAPLGQLAENSTQINIKMCFFTAKKKKYIFLSIVWLSSFSSLPPFCFHPGLKMGAWARGRLVGVIVNIGEG